MKRPTLWIFFGLVGAMVACSSSPGSTESESGGSMGGSSGVGGLLAGGDTNDSGGGQGGRPPLEGGQGGQPPLEGGQGGQLPLEGGQGGQPLPEGGPGGQAGQPPVDAGPERVVAWVTDPASHVNTLIGTTIQGNTFPGADYPFGMVQWSPDTTPDRPSGGGYEYKDTAIRGFSLNHLSGPGCSGAFGDVPILPLTGGLPSGDLQAAKQSFTHTGEVAAAGYYSVNVGNPAIKVELTATLRTGMARFTYPATNNANLLFKLQDSAPRNFGDATASIVGDREVIGSTSAGNFCGTGTPYRVHFDMVFDQPFTASKIVAESGKSTPGFIFLTFDTSKNQVVQAKVGLSYVSDENARANWNAETPSSQWDFSAVKNGAVKAWNDMLGQVQIAGGTATERELFYTSLYHSLLHPNVSSDANGQYVGFDQKVHTLTGNQKAQYVNFSGWDIYHTQVQLSAIVAPQAMSDAAQSMLNDAAQHNGELPKWSLQSGENGIMVGDPADGIIAGYYAFGARQFDAATALKVMVKEATVPNMIRPGLAEYMSIGYYPEDPNKDTQSVGITLEYCQADFALSQFAAALGDTATAAAMLKRSQNWQYVFDASVNMFIPKVKEGTFLPGVGPLSSRGMTEGDATQYRWIIAYNRQSVLAAMGGASVVSPLLDAFFTRLNNFMGPNAFLSNEFGMGSQYWNNHTGEPWKTQEIGSRLRTTMFKAAPDFIDNNDDLGSMSSSLVWAMLGVYPDYPGSARLSLNGPEFTDERIRLPNGKYLWIHGDGASTTSPYIQSLVVDGKPSGKTWIDPSFIENGATLDFVMGAAPNKSWGTAAADAPASQGVEYTSGFAYATPNPLTVAPGASADVTLTILSARSDVSQTISWSASQQGFALNPTSGSVSLAPGTRTTSKVTVTAPAATGNYTIKFQLTSSSGVNPPAFVLPVVVK